MVSTLLRRELLLAKIESRAAALEDRAQSAVLNRRFVGHAIAPTRKHAIRQRISGSVRHGSTNQISWNTQGQERASELLSDCQRSYRSTQLHYYVRRPSGHVVALGNKALWSHHFVRFRFR